MPSVARSYTMPAVIITRTPSPQKQGVAFAKNPVQSVSRPANTKEHLAISLFETHASQCRDCHDPYDAYRHNYELCDAGRRLAREVTSTLYNINEVTYTKNADQELERVEISTSYQETRGLLKANERCQRRHGRPFVAVRRSHTTVQPRAPERQTVRVEQPARSQSVRNKRHSTQQHIVDWPADHTHRTTHINQTSTHKRGSLYAEDLAQRSQEAKIYNLEVRVPSNRASGYYG